MTETNSSTEHPSPNSIIKSPFDHCTYAHVTLPNSLQCLLISDPETDKSSASLDVHVGHLSDPSDLAGLAHFLEHLLFLGTAKYPGENEYSAWLTSVGGGSNAYTDSEHTNYYFDVPNAHLEPALDRFSQFFIHPLFEPNGTERELLAVDSEHAKNLRNDAWRFQQLTRSLSNPAHPWHQFGTGDKTTLGGPTTRDRLIQFYQSHYSSEFMRLVVYGRASTTDMEAWVRTSFSAVPRLKATPERFDPTRPFWQSVAAVRAGKESGTLVYMRSLKPLKTLSLQWMLPDQLPNWQHKPLDLISHCIGHEGPGSLLSYLKKQGWASSLCADSSDRVTGMELYEVSIECTEAGLASYRQIIQAVLSYIDMLTKVDVAEWQRVFEEVKALNEIRFQYKEKASPEDTAASLAQHAHDYPIDYVLVGPYHVKEFKPALVQALLDQLSTKRQENFRVFIQSQLSDMTFDKVEPHYGTEYKVLPFEEPAVETISAFAFPPKNPYIPTDFTVYGEKRPGHQELFPVPKQCAPSPASSSLSLWHHLDSQFLLPKSQLLLLLRTSWPSSHIKRHTCVNLWLDSLLDDLTETLYSASLCGYKYSLGLQPCLGLMLSVNGPSEKLSLLALDILAKWKAYQEPSHATFSMMKEKYEQRLLSFEKESPFRMALYYMNHSMTMDGIYSPAQVLSVLKELDYESWKAEQVASHVWLSLDKAPHSLLYMGNVEEDMAIQFASEAQATLGLALSDKEEKGEKDSGMSCLASRVIALPERCSVALMRPVDNNNSAVETYYQIGTFDDRKAHTLVLLLDQLLNELFFDTLRTKETFGYFVRLQMREDAAGYGILFLVQSSFEPTRIVDRIEQFLAQEALNTLRTMTEAEFAKNVAALSAKLTEKDRKLSQSAQRAWDAILVGHLDFSANVHMNELLATIQKDQVLAAFESWFLKEKKRMIVLMKSQLEHSLKRKPEAEAGDTEDESDDETSPSEPESDSEPTPAPADNTLASTLKTKENNGSCSSLLENMHLASHTIKMLTEAELKEWKNSLPLLPIPRPMSKSMP